MAGIITALSTNSVEALPMFRFWNKIEGLKT